MAGRQHLRVSGFYIFYISLLFHLISPIFASHEAKRGKHQQNANKEILTKESFGTHPFPGPNIQHTRHLTHQIINYPTTKEN